MAKNGVGQRPEWEMRDHAQTPAGVVETTVLLAEGETECCESLSTKVSRMGMLRLNSESTMPGDDMAACEPPSVRG